MNQLICNLLPYIFKQALRFKSRLCYRLGFLIKYRMPGTLSKPQLLAVQSTLFQKEEQIMTPPFPDFQTFRRLCMILQGFYCFSFAIELFLQQPLLVELFLQTLHIIHIKVNKYYQKLTLLFLRVTSLNVTSCADIFAKVCKSTTN